ncbi:MAG: amidohydrolase [Synergistaceae bacterium]|nr:amidohydrolase [Synergistaceae bacterium]
MALDLIAIRRALHQIPETCFTENETAALLLSHITELIKDRPDVQVSRYKTGIILYIPGKAPVKTIGWRADMDGLPISEKTDLPFASRHPGKMHACGHDMHMTVGLGLLERILSAPRKNNFLFLFQPAEEGGGGGKELYDSGILNPFRIDELYGLHVSPEWKPGEIATKPGTLFASASLIRIEFIGKPAHAAMPHLSIDPIVTAASFIMAVQTVVSRNLDPLAARVLTFGMIEGGEAGNAVAKSCTLRGTMRVLTKELMDLGHEKVEKIANNTAATFGAEAKISIQTGAYLPVENNPEITARFIRFARSYSGLTFRDAPITMTAEDFGYLIHNIPGMMFWLGVGGTEPLHSDRFNPDESVMVRAVDFLEKYFTNESGDQ